MSGAIFSLNDGRRIANAVRVVENNGYGVRLGERTPFRGINTGYNGYFKVIIAENLVSVINGFDIENTVAGYAYYNLRSVSCPILEEGELQEGFLCLTIKETSENTFTVSYTYEYAIPSFPALANIGSDNTAKYPLAFISGNETDGWKVQQITRYVIPHLWCFGPCDEE